MKPKTIRPKAYCKPQLPQLPEVTDTTRAQIGQNIGFALDIMNDPRFRNDNFRQIEERKLRSYSLHADNEEVTIHFEIEWKGGAK